MKTQETTVKTRQQIFNTERKFLCFLEAKLPYIALIILAVLGIVIRFALKDVQSDDFVRYLNPWFEQIKEDGLASYTGDYNLAYQFLILIMTKLPFSALYSYKLLSCFFDFALAVGVALLVYQIAERERLWKAVAAYGSVLISPIVFLNSSAWAQCDSMFVCFAILGLLALTKEKYSISMVMFGFAFAFKLQAIFILPIYLFVYFKKKNFSALYFLIAPTTIIIVSAPCFFFGKGIRDIFSIYLAQTGTYKSMSMNFPSFWRLLIDSDDQRYYDLMKIPAIIITFAILICIVILYLRSNIILNQKNIVNIAFIFAFTCVLFLPAMHERYGYIYEILAICIAVYNIKTLPLCLGLQIISLNTYNNYLFATGSFDLLLLSLVNVSIYVAYLFILTKQMMTTTQNVSFSSNQDK